MIATDGMLEMTRDVGTSTLSDTTGITNVLYIPRYRLPDLSRVNRADRRALMAMAKRYGWELT